MNSPNYPFGYCTNVHAGTSLTDAKANLTRYSAAVRQRLVPEGLLPIGLWLAESAAISLIEQNQVGQFARWLRENGFLPYTLNGFPQGDFHQPVVKHSVYEPTWTCESRMRYTLYLAEILDALLEEGKNGAISTLPLGWPHAPWHAENLKMAADNLIEVAKFLDRLAQQSGREVVLAVEPEPGCVLSSATDVVEFFEHYLFRGPDARIARHYLSVCHDICHSSVMFEPQAIALEHYKMAGIRVGKVQVSSAVHVPWDECSDDAQRQAILAQLRALDEPRFLHQTTRSTPEGRFGGLVDDLQPALQRWLHDGSFPSDPWRIHFHVPIFVTQFDQLQTTSAEINDACQYLEANAGHRIDDANWFTGHYEVETYAWPVLPNALAVDDLSMGIAQELEYFSQVLVQGARPNSGVHQ